MTLVCEMILENWEEGVIEKWQQLQNEILKTKSPNHSANGEKIAEVAYIQRPARNRIKSLDGPLNHCLVGQ